MNKKLIMILAPLYILTTTASRAGCEDILKYINYNTAYNYSQLTKEQIDTASLCSEKYDKQSGSRTAQVEASWSALHSGAQGSEQQIRETQEKECKGHYGKEYLSSIGIQQTQIVSQQAVDAVKACYDSKQFHLTTLTFTENSFSSAFTWSGTGDITFNSAVVSADPNFADSFDPAGKIATCSVRYKNQVDITRPFKVASGTNVSVTCDRTAHVVTDQRTHSSVKEYPEGIVTIVTEAQNVAIPLIRIARTITPDDRIERIEADITTIKGAIKSLVEASTKQTSDMIDFGNRLKVLEDNKNKLKLFWKGGNNGMAACGQYCRDTSRWPTSEGAGTCVAAKIVSTIGFPPPQPDAAWNCDKPLDGSGQSNVLCLCANVL